MANMSKQAIISEIKMRIKNKKKDIPELIASGNLFGATSLQSQQHELENLLSAIDDCNLSTPR